MKNPVYGQNCGDNLDIRLVLRQPIEVMDESTILIGVKKNLNSPVVLTPARRSRANGALWLVFHLSILSLCLHLLCCANGAKALTQGDQTDAEPTR